MADALLSLKRSLPRLNCPLWIRRSRSMAAIVTTVVLNRSKPSIGAMRNFTPLHQPFAQVVIDRCVSSGGNVSVRGKLARLTAETVAAAVLQIGGFSILAAFWRGEGSAIGGSRVRGRFCRPVRGVPDRNGSAR